MDKETNQKEVVSRKLITIVVPVYNVEKYITKCLDSLVLDDPELMKQLEVIIINDGTPDRSAELSREYVKRYPETFRQIDKENGHYGSCINRGLAEARGKYIKILDADDWFDNGAFRQFISKLESTHDVDLIMTDYQDVDDMGRLIRCCKPFNVEQNRPMSLRDFEEPKTSFFIHSLTYRADFLRSIGYHQTEGIPYTDCEWSYIPPAHVGRFVYYPIDLYRYRLGREGQSMDPRVLVKTVDSHMQVCRNIIRYYDSLPESDLIPNNFSRADNAIYSICLNIYKLCLVEQTSGDYRNSGLKEFDSYLKRVRPEVYVRIGEMVLRGFPLKYVRFWRKCGFRFPLALVRDIVRKIRYS